MCKIILGLKDEGKNDKALELLRAQYDDLKRERDGIGAFVMDKTGRIEIFRHLNDYEPIFECVEDRLDKAVAFGIHTRTATSGNRDLANVHFFDKDGYLFAHNGIISKFHTSRFSQQSWVNYHSGSKRVVLGFSGDQDYGEDFMGRESDEKERMNAEATIATCSGCASAKIGFCRRHKNEGNLINYYEMRDSGSYEDTPPTEIITPTKNEVIEMPTSSSCDSLQFLENMPKPFDETSLQNFIDESKFSGLGIVVDSHKSEIWALVDKQCHFITKKDFSFIFSFTPTSEISYVKTKEARGIDYIVEAEDKEINYPTHEIVLGLYKLKVGVVSNTRQTNEISTREPVVR